MLCACLVWPCDTSRLPICLLRLKPNFRSQASISTAASENGVTRIQSCNTLNWIAHDLILSFGNLKDREFPLLPSNYVFLPFQRLDRNNLRLVKFDLIMVDDIVLDNGPLHISLSKFCQDQRNANRLASKTYLPFTF